MKPTISTPSTAIIGYYVASQSVAVVGSLRTESGDVRPAVIERTGAPWQALADALTDAAHIGAEHVVLLTNDAATMAALSRPFPAPTGNDAHWQVLRLLGWTWAGRWRVQMVADLPAARALWEAQLEK